MAVNQVSLFFYPPRWEQRLTPDPTARTFEGGPVRIADSVPSDANDAPVVSGEAMKAWLERQGFTVAAWGGGNVFERGKVQSILKSGRQYRAVRRPPDAPDFNNPRTFPRIFRKHAGPGYRHVLLVRHVRAFLEILPDWPTLSAGLNAILLAPERPGCDGFHRPGLVAVCAQPRNLCQLVTNPHYVDRHRDIFSRLGVPVERTPEGHLLHFTESTLRAYQLLHILLHELGHHHDRMTTRSGRRSSRGESFAELYARTQADHIWSRYFTLFPP